MGPNRPIAEQNCHVSFISNWISNNFKIWVKRAEHSLQTIIVQTLNLVTLWPFDLVNKYKRWTISGCKDIGFSKLKSIVNCSVPFWNIIFFCNCNFYFSGNQNARKLVISSNNLPPHLDIHDYKHALTGEYNYTVNSSW